MGRVAQATKNGPGHLIRDSNEPRTGEKFVTEQAPTQLRQFLTKRSADKAFVFTASQQKPPGALEELAGYVKTAERKGGHPVVCLILMPEDSRKKLAIDPDRARPVFIS